MQLEAIYDNGRLELTSSVQLAARRFAVRIEVPDSEVIQDATAATAQGIAADAAEWLRRLDTIRAEVLATPEGELAPIRDQDRLDAFALREDR